MAWNLGIVVLVYINEIKGSRASLYLLRLPFSVSDSQF